MNNKQKKVARWLILLILIIAGITLALKFLPVNILFQRSSNPESEFINGEKVKTTAPDALSFDFEVDPKSGEQKGLYKGIAHSGNFSAKAFGKNTYTLTLERKASDIGLENMKAVALSTWVYVFPGKDDVVSSLVFAASNNGINLTWQGVNLYGNDMPRGKWFKISGFFNLSEIVFNPDTKLQFYFWNNSSNDILVDDFYIVFGGPGERRGDSALVDMTRGAGYAPRFNLPPFPFHYLAKDEIGNENSQYLVKQGDLKEGEIRNTDRVITGHFITPATGTEDILVIKKDGKPELFLFGKERNTYQKVTPVFPADVMTGISQATVLKGAFTGKSNDQLLLIGERAIHLCEPEKNRNSGGSSGQGKGDAQLQWKQTLLSLPGITGNKGTSCYAADLNGDKITELLAVHPDGSWKIYSFTPNPLHPAVTESGKGGAVAEWSAQMTERKITPGRFMQKYPQDLLLTVFSEKGKPGYSYNLSRFDAGTHTFISCFPQKQNNLGRTTGRDTLKPGDEFFIGNFDNSGVQKIFRYHRDWRFDLKEITFNDTTFQVLANIDFTGYEKDHNPKYFESLGIYAGSFLKPGLASFLLIQENPKNRDNRSLPPAIQVYSFKKTE